MLVFCMFSYNGQNITTNLTLLTIYHEVFWQVCYGLSVPLISSTNYYYENIVLHSVLSLQFKTKNSAYKTSNFNDLEFFTFTKGLM